MMSVGEDTKIRPPYQDLMCVLSSCHRVHHDLQGLREDLIYECIESHITRDVYGDISLALNASHFR